MSKENDSLKSEQEYNLKIQKISVRENCIQWSINLRTTEEKTIEDIIDKSEKMYQYIINGKQDNA